MRSDHFARSAPFSEKVDNSLVFKKKRTRKTLVSGTKKKKIGDFEIKKIKKIKENKENKGKWTKMNDELN